MSRDLPPPSRLLAGVVLLAVACGVDSVGSNSEGPGGPDAPGDPPGGNGGSPSPSGAIVLLVGDPADLNGSEREIREYLGGFGREVRTVDDDGFSIDRTTGCDLVVMSKTVQSEKISDRLRPTACGVVFWEDNQQMTHMMGTISNDGSAGTDWHGIEDDVFIRPEAPAELRARLSGERDFYVRHDEITWAPRSDLTGSATVVAEFDENGGHPTVYVIERGGRLADGSAAAGRRAFFGLHDDTFRLLTADGRALFDAIVRWAMG